MSHNCEWVRSLTDLEGSDYLRYQLPHSERVKHLESWLREALILPFSYDAAIDANGDFISFGQKMVEINEHALEVRKGQVGEARVKAEMEGVVRLEELLNKAEVGDTLFLFSPPGLTEEGFGQAGQRRLSFTYIFQVEEGINGDKRRVRSIAIPTLEISAETQVKQFSNVFLEADVVAITDNKDQVPIDRKLVSTPILVTGLDESTKAAKLDEYMRVYSGKSWDELEKVIENGLKLKEDEHAEGRRKSLINSISWQIRRYVDERDSKRLNNIGEAARVVLAREASGHFLGMTPEELLSEYSKTENSMWIQIQYQCASSTKQAEIVEEYGDQIVASEMHLRSIRDSLVADPRAFEILSGSACGGGGMGEAIDAITVDYGKVVIGSGHLIERTLEKLKEPTSSNESMSCVTCPFCKEIVDAIVTAEKIECPKCHETASRG